MEAPNNSARDFDLTSVSRSVPQIIRTHLLDMPQLTGATIPEGGRTFYAYTGSSILKLGADNGEALMTALAHEVLGPIAPRLEAIVSITEPPKAQGVLITRQPGTPLVELWPTLSPEQRSTVKNNIAHLLVRMRARNPPFDFYGRPGGLPYVTMSEFDPPDEHAYCHTRVDWDASRTRALKAAALETGLDDDRIRALERVQCETTGTIPQLIDAPVLTHGDLSDRNILVDPTTFQVTGLIDWELANVAPAYLEYAAARISGGHEPEWRKEVLSILQDVLRIECGNKVTPSESYFKPEQRDEETEKLFEATLAAWRTLVDVERAAQGYSDDCYWTFEDDSQTLLST